MGQDNHLLSGTEECNLGGSLYTVKSTFPFVIKLHRGTHRLFVPCIQYLCVRGGELSSVIIRK